MYVIFWFFFKGVFEEFEKKEFTKDNVFSLKHLRFIAHLNLEEQGDHFETIQIDDEQSTKGH